MNNKSVWNDCWVLQHQFPESTIVTLQRSHRFCRQYSAKTKDELAILPLLDSINDAAGSDFNSPVKSLWLSELLSSKHLSKGDARIQLQATIHFVDVDAVEKRLSEKFPKLSVAINAFLKECVILDEFPSYYYRAQCLRAWLLETIQVLPSQFLPSTLTVSRSSSETQSLDSSISVDAIDTFETEKDFSELCKKMCKAVVFAATFPEKCVLLESRNEHLDSIIASNVQVLFNNMINSYLKHIKDSRRWTKAILYTFRHLTDPEILVSNFLNICPLEWSQDFFQYYLSSNILDDTIANAFSPYNEYKLSFWSRWQRQFETIPGVEVNSNILDTVNSLLLSRSTQYSNIKASTSTSLIASSYYSLTYAHSPNQLSVLSFNIERGFSQSTGLALWPASFALSEYILNYSENFKGVTSIELGAGLALPSYVLATIGAKKVIVTDNDERSLENVEYNWRNNIDTLKIHAKKLDTEPTILKTSSLDWSNDCSTFIDFEQPTVVLSTDTIYLPEYHDALANTVLTILRKAKDFGNPDAESVCYFSQVERNPESFLHYEATFRQYGMKIEDISLDTLQRRFVYDRKNVRLQRISLL